MTRFSRRLGRVAVVVFLCSAATNGGQSDGGSVVDDVFYHFMPIAWRDSDGDSFRFGDFDGMTDSLDYLVDLGITAVWMNPIFPSAAYHGYQHGRGDQINSRLGDEASFLNFVNEAHARGIKVFVDLVVYGISQDTVWFQSAFGTPGSAYDDWLAFENGANTQYLGSVYSTWNGSSVGLIHWDLRDAGPTALVTAWARKWLDPNNDGDPSDGIDGYRLDHVWNQYPNGPNGWGYNIGWWENWNAALESINPDVFIFAEQADWGSTGADLHSAFDASFTKPFEFAARDALRDEFAAPLYSAMGAAIGSLPAGKQFMCIIGDHDVDRLASVIGDNLLKGRVAAAVLLTQPFPPIIYHGDELGMRGVKGNYGSDANDIPMREPFKWNAVAGVPMSNYWILNNQAFNNAYSQDNDGRSVEEQAGVPDSLLEHYKTLVTARRGNIALRHGGYHAVSNSSSRVWSFLRHAEGEQTVLVAINLLNATLSIDLDLSMANIVGDASLVHDVIANVDLPDILTTANKSAYALTMEPYGYHVLEVNATIDAPDRAVDGDLISTDFGPPALRATQSNFTSMGDNVNELNQMFAAVGENVLSMGITGNLATDGTGLALLIDSRAGGQEILDTATFSEPPSGIPQLDGMVMDTGFSPDSIVYTNAFGGSIFVDLYELSTNGGGSKRYIGSGTVGDGDGFLNGGNNPNGALVALKNSNVVGVSAVSASQAATSVSGFELELPFNDLNIGVRNQPIRVLAMLVRPDGNVGNQMLPGLGLGTPDLGTVPIDLNALDNNQFVVLNGMAPVPAASMWAVAVLTLLLLSAGLIVFRRRDAGV